MKKYLWSFLMCMAAGSAFAQISIQPVLPMAGVVQKNNLWNIAVTNTSNNTFSCRIELTLRERSGGMEVLTATTGSFQISTGAKQLNASNLLPVQYNYISPAFSSRTDDFIPIGDYIACYRLTAGKDILAEECAAFDVEPLSPPMLINPADSSMLEVEPSQFAWIPPAPMNLFSRLQYEVVITDIMPGQKAEEAMQQNLPFYTEPNVPVNNLAYKGMASSFEKGKWYAWQVVARDDNSYAAKSEVWTFQVKEPSVAQMIVEMAPYIKMKKNDPEKGIAPNGMLRLSYLNETTDSTAQIKIVDLSDQQRRAYEFTTGLKAGENLIEYNVKKKFKLEEQKVYEVQLINSRNERWMMQFEIHEYK